LKTFHILFLNETHFDPLSSNVISFIDSKKHLSINVYAQNGTMIIYDKFTTLSSYETFTILGVRYITTTFNTNYKKVIYVIVIYKLSTLLFLTFINQLQKLLDLMPTYCLIVIMGDFNIGMFDQLNTAK
jgi:hypothetical protein